jgi:hypothetical protein
MNMHRVNEVAVAATMTNHANSRMGEQS